jgi:hypothetical protein
MKEIALTQGLVTIVDTELYHVLNKFNWYALKAGDQKFYAATKSLGRGTTLLHRYIFSLMNLDIEDQEIDHIDRNRLNNQYLNLRIVDRTSNLQNQGLRTDNTSGFKGVAWDKSRQRWLSKICVNKKQINLGRYDNRIVAAQVYDTAAKKYFGEYACLNFPDMKDENNESED